MKRVWLLTRRFGYNFGSTLQAYALLHAFKKNGYSAQIVDYDEAYYHKRWKVKPIVLNIIWTIFACFRPFFRLLFPKKFDFLRIRNMQIGYFNAFEKQFFNLTRQKFGSKNSLQKGSINIDACVCGSDQIWNPNLFDSNYFLDFCAPHVNTIAYAPSFGVSSLDSHEDEIKELLGKIDHISVREVEGAEIVKRLTGASVPIVLDPTLLLTKEEWTTFIKPDSRSPYLLCYFIGNSIPYKYISEFSKRVNLKIVNLTTFRTENIIPCDECIYGSPEEFISLIAHAQYVLTDSFHGTVFSIIFEREFYTYERFSSNDGNSQNSRIYTLLGMLNLNDRIIHSNTETDAEFNTINYPSVAELLVKRRIHSIEYLMSSLNDVKTIV